MYLIMSNSQNLAHKAKATIEFFKLYGLYQSFQNLVKRKTRLYPYYAKFKENHGYHTPVDLEIALTYGCNINCAYCYAKGLEKKFNPISISNFTKILDWLTKQNKNRIRLIGGEPTNHPQIEKILSLCQKRKFKFELASNGIYEPKLNRYLSPNNVIYCLINFKNSNQYNNKNHYKTLLNNIKTLHNKKVSIVLKYNLTEHDDFNSIIDIAKRYLLDINFSLPNLGFSNKIYIDWSSANKNILKKVMDFVITCKKKGIYCYFGRPIPRCSFSEKDWKFLTKYARVRSKCAIGELNNPDGGLHVTPDLQVFACSNLFTTTKKKLIDYDNINDVLYDYQDYIQSTQWSIPLLSKCKSCDYFNNNICQGGCLGNKLNNKEFKKDEINIIKNQ